MGGLSGLASLGYFAGGAAKGYQSAEEERRRQEEHNYLQEERGRERTMQDAIKKAQGLEPEQYQTGDVTYKGMTGGLDMQDIPRETTTGYRMGGQDQPTPFTPDQVQGLRADETARALSARGTPQAIAAAEALKTGIQQREAAGLKIKSDKITLGHQEAASQFLDWSRRLATGEDPASIYKDLYEKNKNIPNGYGSSPIVDVDGQPHIVVWKEGSGEKQLMPLNADTLKGVLSEGYKFSSEKAYNDALTHETKKKELDLKGREIATAEAKQKTDEKLGAAHVIYYTKAGEALERNSKRGPVGHAASWALVGTDSDGVGVQHDRTSGTFKRIDGGKIQDVNFFKKITGAAAPTGPDPVEAALIKSVERDPATNMPLLEKYRANKAMNTRRAGYNPEDQGPPAPGPTPGPTSAVPGSGHPVRPQRPPGMSQAEWQRQEVMRIQNAREAARVQDLEGAPEGIDDPMFSRGSPLYR